MVIQSNYGTDPVAYTRGLLGNSLVLFPYLRCSVSVTVEYTPGIPRNVIAIAIHCFHQEIAQEE